MHSLDKTLLAFALLHYVLQGQTCLLLQASLPTFAFQCPMMKRTSFFLVLVLEDLVGFKRTIQLQLLQHQCLGHRLGLLRCWMICLGKALRSFFPFEIAPTYCISDSLVDYEGYSSMGLLPTVVNIMVI